MIKDVFVLKKNSWHTKLMKRIWGWDYYDFSNMCPYFWLTIVNVIISPFIILFDVAKLIATKINNFIRPYLEAMAIAYEKRCEEKKERWYDKYLDRIDNILIKENPTEQDFKLLEKIRDADWDKNRDLFLLWRNKLDSEKKGMLNQRYYELQDSYYEKKRQEDYKKQEIKTVKEKNNRQKIAEILPVAKLIVKGLGVVAILFVAFLLYKLAIIVIGWDWLTIIKKFGIGFGAAILILTALYLLYLTFKVLIKIIVKLWCVFGKYCVPCEENRDKIGNGFESVGKAFVYPFVKIGEGFRFMWDLAVTLKRNNCPGIDWED